MARDGRCSLCPSNGECQAAHRRRRAAGARLQAHGVSPVTLSPLRLQRYDTASSASRANTRIGVFPGMFFIPVFLFGLSSAIDSTAGVRLKC